jgi:predicted nucleic acid-binding protein
VVGGGALGGGAGLLDVAAEGDGAARGAAALGAGAVGGAGSDGQPASATAASAAGHDEPIRARAIAPFYRVPSAASRGVSRGVRPLGLLVRTVRAGDELWSVSVVRTEILAGMRRGEEAATTRLLAQLEWLDVTGEVADRGGALARQHLRSHPRIDTVEYLAAAAAQVLSAGLLTRNVKHYPMFRGLAPAYR